MDKCYYKFSLIFFDIFVKNYPKALTNTLIYIIVNNLGFLLSNLANPRQIRSSQLHIKESVKMSLKNFFSKICFLLIFSYGISVLYINQFSPRSERYKNVKSGIKVNHIDFKEIGKILEKIKFNVENKKGFNILQSLPKNSNCEIIKFTFGSGIIVNTKNAKSRKEIIYSKITCKSGKKDYYIKTKHYFLIFLRYISFF